MKTAVLLVVVAFLASVTAKPSNDVTLYTRALFQDCDDSNRDSLAVKFLEGNEKWIAEHKTARDVAREALQKVSDHNIVYFSARTNYIDDKLEEWTKDRSIEQVVVIAAGFDSRAYRMELPHVRFFEVDFPSVMENKKSKVEEQGIKPTCKSVSYVGADLRVTDLEAALKATEGFDSKKKTIFIVEGLIYYLHQGDVDKLFASIDRVAANGSKIVLDFVNQCVVDGSCPDLNDAFIKIFKLIIQAKGEPFYSGFEPNTVAKFLSRFGFKTTELLSFLHAGEAPLNVKTWTNSKIFGQMNFVSGEKDTHKSRMAEIFV